MNKKILSILILGMFFISFASAGLLQSNKVFSRTSLMSADKIELKSLGINNFKNYGKYEIHENGFLGLFRGDIAQEYTLLDSGNSIINAWAYLKVTNYKQGKLFSNLWFKGNTPKEVNVYYLENKSYVEEIPEYKQVCEKIFSVKNKTAEKVCSNVKVGSKKVTKYKTSWIKYKGQSMPSGVYYVKISAKKPINKPVDWILKSGIGEYDLEEWAWWNANWEYKREINITENSGNTLNNYSVLLNVSYDNDMKEDLGDIRFTNSAEDTELGYWIDNMTGAGRPYDNFDSGLTNGLVSYYKLDETSGTTATDSHGSNDGTNNGATVNVAGKINTAYDFDGSNDYVDIGTIGSMSAMTVSAWVVFDDVSDRGRIIGSSGDNPFLYVNSGTLKWRVGSGSEISTPISSGVSFRHVVGTYDGSTLKLYVDGILKASGSSSGSSDSSFDIGRKEGSADSVDYLDGKIDEVGIWNRALSDSEVKELYNITSARIWVKVPTLTASSNTSMYMYYGNSGASSTSEFNDAFVFADDFEGSVLDTTKWIKTTTGSSTIALSSDYKKVGDSSLKIYDAGDGKSYVENVSSISQPQVFSVWLYESNSGSSEAQVFKLDTSSGNTVAVGPHDGHSADYYYYRFGSNEYVSTISRTNGWHKFEVVYDGTYYKIYIDGSYIATSPSGYGYVTQKSLGSFWDGESSTFYWDSFSQRLYASTEPTYSIGEERQVSGVSTTLNSPEDNYNSSSSSITFNWTSNPTNANLVNTTLYIWYSNGTLLTTSYHSLSGSSAVTTTDTKTLSDGNYIWNAESCSDPTETGCTFAPSNRTLEVDTTAPTISISSPTGTYDYKKVGDSEWLNVTLTDTNLDTCWYDYNGTNVTFSCSSGIEADNTFLLESGNTNMTIYANDTFGNLGSTIADWYYKIFEINNSYNNFTIEGNLENFLTYSILKSGLDVSNIYFVYDGTEYVADSFTSGEYTIFRKNNFLIPEVTIEGDKTFYWKVILSDSTEINLSSNTQTVYNLAIDNCSTYTNTILNFTLLDEETQDMLSDPTIETAINIYSSDRNSVILNYSLLSHSNPTKICLNHNLLNNTIYSLDAIVRYETNVSANEYYNIVNYTLNNESGTNNINLYDLNLDDSTEFQLTFIGSDFLPVENALIYVNRQYISENTFKTVELPKTDYNGQTILHLVRNDVIYNIQVVKDGEVLGTYNNLVAFCDDYSVGDCNIDLNAFSSVENVYDYYSDLGLTFGSPSYNETLHQVKFNFIVTDGSSKEVTMNITRNDIFGNTSICETSLTSSGGTLTCNIDPNLEDTTLKVNIYLEGNLIISSYINLENEGYGESGYLILFIMAISFALMFSGSKSGVLISIIVTFIGGISLGIMKGDLIGIGASGIWLLLIVIIGLWKLNSERQQ